MSPIEQFIGGDPFIRDLEEFVSLAKAFFDKESDPFTYNTSYLDAVDNGLLLQIQCARRLVISLCQNLDSESTELIKLVEKAFPLHCPKEGAFIAYKKVDISQKEGMFKPGIATLIVPERAWRSSAFGKKCRASEVVVTEIEDVRGNNSYMRAKSGMFGIGATVAHYVVSETTFADSFDKNRWKECSHGVHFFMTKEEAIAYH